MKSSVRRCNPLAKTVLVVAFVLGNLYVAMSRPGEVSAHFAGTHFHKGGTAIRFGVWNFGIYQEFAQRALSDHYNRISLLYWDYPNQHTEISIYDESFGNTEWCGYHQPYDDGYHRSHSHSVYNRDCGGDPNYVQGVYCQEIAHAWSQDHHTVDNSCMGLGYGGSGIYITEHDNQDFYDFYRWH